MKCCRRYYVSQTFAINTFRFVIFSSKKPFPTRVFVHRTFFNHFVNIFAKKTAEFLNISNKNAKMLTNFITKTFYYIKYSSFRCRLMINRHIVPIKGPRSGNTSNWGLDREIHQTSPNGPSPGTSNSCLH